ncbi:MAG: hypothetical protein C0501_16535 [Isosphaera sp.]|nr:hypothetical protein [Isosphaera sp.]
MPHLNSLLPPLLRCLETEGHLLRDARAVLGEVHAALRRGDLPAVAAAGPQQEALAAALRAAEADRAAASAEVARAVGLAADGPTLAALAARLPDPWADEVASARARLAAAATALADQRGRNANLIRQLRAFFRGVLPSLAAGAPGRYGPSGAPVDPAGGGAITARG